jgi:hypothetical protein
VWIVDEVVSVHVKAMIVVLWSPPGVHSHQIATV